MPRIARGLVDGFIYHVLNRGNGRQEIFHREKDYEAFISLMEKAKERYLAKIFAYCLLPNHFHMVLMPNRAEDLSRWLQWLMTSYVRRYHRHYGGSGHVWTYEEVADVSQHTSAHESATTRTCGL